MAMPTQQRSRLKLYGNFYRADMTTDPLVTVIVPVYNVEDYLDRCIASILDQSYRRLQIILVNDGSTDSSGSMCDGYLRDERIQVIHQTNGGLSHARNVGLDHAYGDYLTFVDSDDWIAPDFVRTLLEIARSHDAATTVSRVHKTSVEDQLPETVHPVMVLDRDEALREFTGKLHTLLTIACAKLYRSEVFDGVRFPVGRLHEDEFTTYRALAASERIVIAPTAMYFYWQREDSITGLPPSSRNWIDVMAAYRERLAFFELHAPADIAAKARLELFRKLLHYDEWLAERGERDGRVHTEMRQLEQEMTPGIPVHVRAYCAAHLRWPRLTREALALMRSAQSLVSRVFTHH